MQNGCKISQNILGKGVLFNSQNDNGVPIFHGSAGTGTLLHINCSLISNWGGVGVIKIIKFGIIYFNVSIYGIYCQQLEYPHSSLPFWPHYMSSAHSIYMTCTCVNNTTFNQLKVVHKPEIQALRCKRTAAWVGTLELLAVRRWPCNKTLK